MLYYFSSEIPTLFIRRLKLFAVFSRRVNAAVETLLRWNNKGCNVLRKKGKIFEKKLANRPRKYILHHLIKNLRL